MSVDPSKALAFAYLKKFPLFQQLKDSVIDSFSTYAQIRDMPKGAILFTPDQPYDKFNLILSGWVKIYKETLGGDEAVIDVLTEGHTFGEIALAGTQNMPYGAEVVENATILSIPRFLLTEEVMRNSVFGLSILQFMTKDHESRAMEIEHHTLQNAPQRIGCFILRLCKEQDGSNAATIHLPYDKTIVARRLGMQPETFSRALAKLRDETGINVRGASVDIPDIAALARYTCSACSSSFPCKN